MSKFMLSKNLSLFEFTHAGSAKVVGKEEQFNPSPQLINNAYDFAQHCFQPIRDYINLRYGTGVGLPEIPLFSKSYYRTKLVNDYVHGSKKSYHLKAMAGDLFCIVNKKTRNDLILEAIKFLQIPFTELILEFGTLRNPMWIHLALDENNICYTAKRAIKVDGKTVYSILDMF